MLLLTRAMISSTTDMSLDWLAADGGATVVVGGTVPEGNAAWACCPTNQGAPSKNVVRMTVDFFINNLIGTGQLTQNLT